jgi:hypothetical protein
MPKLKKDAQTPEQIFAKNRWNALYDMARRAGFDDDALAWSEFCLMPFFEQIVEHCAEIADVQSRVYSDGNAGKGASNAANAIRNFGKIIGNERN